MNELVTVVQGRSKVDGKEPVDRWDLIWGSSVALMKRPLLVDGAYGGVRWMEGYCLAFSSACCKEPIVWADLDENGDPTTEFDYPFCAGCSKIHKEFQDIESLATFPPSADRGENGVSPDEFEDELRTALVNHMGHMGLDPLRSELGAVEIIPELMAIVREGCAHE